MKFPKQTLQLPERSWHGVIDQPPFRLTTGSLEKPCCHINDPRKLVSGSLSVLLYNASRILVDAIGNGRRRVADS